MLAIVTKCIIPQELTVVSTSFANPRYPSDPTLEGFLTRPPKSSKNLNKKK